MRRSESKRSHSWWFDGHISPKNSKWLQENLEEMDQSIKGMFKVLGFGEGTHNKTAEIYFQKIPEQMSLVEKFYRGYRSLAERYNHVTGELRGNIPTLLQSHGSGISDGKHHKMRSESKKSHSWWWDSHISPKNSKWLQENLEEMDQSIKGMFKILQIDEDTRTETAEFYFQRIPEQLSLVEEFYRTYSALAERYDHVTGELRKNIPTDLQSQGSGMSDVSSEPTSTWPSPDQRLSRRKSGPRATGFEFPLGAGGNSTESTKEGDESSTLDSESESDDSSVDNYVGVQHS